MGPPSRAHAPERNAKPDSAAGTVTNLVAEVGATVPSGAVICEIED